MSAITIRTIQFEENDTSSLCRDHCIKRNLDGTLFSVNIDYIHSYDSSSAFKAQDVKVSEKNYSGHPIFIHEFMGEIKMKQDQYSYLEIEIQCFKNKKRHSREFKISLVNKDCFIKFNEVEKFLESFFRPESLIEEETRVKLEVNETEIINVDVQKKIKELEDKGHEMMKMMTEEIQSRIEDKLSEMSPEPEEGKKKKKSLIKRLLRK